jgi:hypothetical protein
VCHKAQVSFSHIFSVKLFDNSNTLFLPLSSTYLRRIWIKRDTVFRRSFSRGKLELTSLPVAYQSTLPLPGLPFPFLLLARMSNCNVAFLLSFRGEKTPHGFRCAAQKKCLYRKSFPSHALGVPSHLAGCLPPSLCRPRGGERLKCEHL